MEERQLDRGDDWPGALCLLFAVAVLLLSTRPDFLDSGVIIEWCAGHSRAIPSSAKISSSVMIGCCGLSRISAPIISRNCEAETSVRRRQQLASFSCAMPY